MITSLTYRGFAELVKRRLANGWPTSEFNITDNEIISQFYQVAGAAITNASNQVYAVEGIRPIPEGFITTYKFDLSQVKRDKDNGDYIVDLPSPPLNLPLGYSILSPYFSGNAKKSMPLIAVHGFQKGYGTKMPNQPVGVFYQVEGSKFMMYSPTFDLTTSGLKLNVGMQTPRSATGDADNVINLTDDTMNLVMEQVIAKFTDRLQRPTDIVNDGVKQP